MSRWKQLNARKAELQQQGAAILDSAPGGTLNHHGQVLFDTIQAQLRATNLELAEVESGMEQQRRVIGNGTALARVIGSGPRGRTVAELFPDAMSAGDPTMGFSSLRDFFVVASSGLADERLKLISAGGTGMNEAVPSEGGFLVPVEYSSEILDAALEGEIVRPRADVRPMISNVKAISGFDTLNHTGGSIGGFFTQWLDEGDAGVPQKGRTRRIELHAKKAGVFTMATNELAEDGRDFDVQLKKVLQDGVAWGLDDAFLNGTGTTRPLGVFFDPALITVPKETTPAQASATIVTANVLNMFSRLHPACVGNSVWVCNPTCLPQIMSLVLGSGVAVTLLYQGDPTGKTFGQLLGRPLLCSEKLPVLGTAGDLLLADFSQYVIGIRREIILQKSIHVGWSTDESGYRILVRCDGQGKWNAPVTPKNGPQLSWVVTLGAR